MKRTTIKLFCCVIFISLIFCIHSIPACARNTISAGGNHTVGIKTDGTVVAVGAYKYGQCDVENWTDIIEVAAGAWHTVGLKSDGTVVAVGDNGCGQCDVSDWEDIVSVAAGGAFRKGHTVGLKLDGTVVAVGNNDDGQCNVSGWKDIIAIAAGQSHTIGLKRDGTVIATGNNNDGQCDVSKWKNIIAISADDNSSIGLNSKGASFGNINYIRTRNNKTINAIAAGSDYALRLISDGTVDDLGWRGQWFSSKDSLLFTKWQNIVAVAAGGHTGFGLKADGTVVANGENNYGQCNVEDWRNIRIDLSTTIPDATSTNSHSATASDDSSIVDLSSGCFKKNLQELALPIDFRLAMNETNLGAEVAESNVKMRGRSNYIIAIGKRDDSGISKKRVATICGIDKDGERTDGTDNIDIVKLDTVIYSKDTAQILSVITAVMSVCEKSLLTDQILDAAIELCKDAIANGYSQTYIQNGLCYEMSIDFLDQINLEVYASDVLDDKNATNQAGNSKTFSEEMNNRSVYADDDSSNPFNGWTDDQIVFMLGQLKAEINRRGLTCPKDSFASTPNDNYDDYDFSGWSDDDLLLSLEQVKEIITEKGLLGLEKVIPTPKPTNNTSTSKSSPGNNSATSSKNSGSSSKGSTSFYGKDRSRDAWVCAIKYVEDNLKAPSTAKFCKYTDATVMRVGEDEYIVHGYVDAQNSFGATVRQNWTVDLVLTEKGFRDPYLEWG